MPGHHTHFRELSWERGGGGACSPSKLMHFRATECGPEANSRSFEMPLLSNRW